MAAYTQYVLEQNIDIGEGSLGASLAKLTPRDYKIFLAMLEQGETSDHLSPEYRVMPLEESCDGPKRRLRDFGRLSCGASALDFVVENRI